MLFRSTPENREIVQLPRLEVRREGSLRRSRALPDAGLPLNHPTLLPPSHLQPPIPPPTLLPPVLQSPLTPTTLHHLQTPQNQQPPTEGRQGMGGPLGARARTGTTAVRAPARALHSQVSTFLFLSEARSDPAPFAVAVVAITSRVGGQNFVSSQTVTGYAAIAAASSAASVASRSSALAEAA